MALRVRPGGWPWKATFGSAEATQLDTNIETTSKAVFDDGVDRILPSANAAALKAINTTGWSSGAIRRLPGIGLVEYLSTAPPAGEQIPRVIVPTVGGGHWRMLLPYDVAHGVPSLDAGGRVVAASVHGGIVLSQSAASTSVTAMEGSGSSLLTALPSSGLFTPIAGDIVICTVSLQLAQHLSIPDAMARTGYRTWQARTTDEFRLSLTVGGGPTTWDTTYRFGSDGATSVQLARTASSNFSGALRIYVEAFMSIPATIAIDGFSASLLVIRP